MIATTEALSDAIDAAQTGGAVGIDTEFIWERTYYPILGLVQIGYPDGNCKLIDAPKIQDWSPLKKLIEDKKTVKILHDAQQDLTILRRNCGARPRNIFDTQRAAGFVGLSSTTSLSGLLKELLNVRLSKSETRSDWLNRPLSEKQKNYAEDDVRYSTRLMHEILKKADRLNRRSWIQEEMCYYENEAIYAEFDPETEMLRVRGSGKLTHQQRNVLRALGIWREQEARKRNLPRNFIFSDNAIITLLQKIPTSIDSIRPCKGLTEKTLKYNRTKIWAAIERGISGDLPNLSDPGNKKQPTPDEGCESRIDLSLALVKGTCLAAQMDPALIGNRADIASLVLESEIANVSRHKILSGWRKDFIGTLLLDVLEGKSNLRINTKTRLPEVVKNYSLQSYLPIDKNCVPDS